MKVQLPLGDVVDKVTILLLKRRHMADAAKQANVSRELEVLRSAWAAEGLQPMPNLAAWEGLCEVNAKLWQVEDELREHEARRRHLLRHLARHRRRPLDRARRLGRRLARLAERGAQQRVEFAEAVVRELVARRALPRHLPPLLQRARIKTNNQTKNQKNNQTKRIKKKNQKKIKNKNPKKESKK